MLKNIVVINDFSQVNGGASQVALSGATGLARRGYRVALFSAVGPHNTVASAAGITVVSTHQYETITDPNRLRAATQGIWNQLARKQLRRLLTSFDPSDTVVHVHSWVKALSSSVIREAIDRNFTVICTLHDYFAACPNGGFFDYQIGQPCGETALSLGCIRRNCDSRSYPQKLWRVARHLVQKAFGGVPGDIRHYISVSEFSERILRAYLPSSATIDRIHNPIDVEKHGRADVANNNAFVYVGRLSPEKGVATFAEAAAIVGMRAVFVGDGPAERQIKILNPAAQITGWLSRDQVIDQIRQARALVMPSLLFETQGLTVSEAASQGISAIVSDRCAAREAVGDSHTGLWFAGGNTQDLALKMTTMTIPGVAATMGAAAYDAYWASPATLARHVDELEQLFTRYLHQRKATHLSSGYVATSRK